MKMEPSGENWLYVKHLKFKKLKSLKISISLVNH